MLKSPRIPWQGYNGQQIFSILVRLGERSKLPQRGLGRNPSANDFDAFWTELKPSGAT